MKRDQRYRDQPTLFDFAKSTAVVDPPASRKSDPATNHAAEPLTSNRRYLRGLFLDQVYQSPEPLTAGEIAARASSIHEGVIAESVRKRAKELVDAGEIVVVGERKCTVSGKLCRVFGVRRRERC